MSLPESTLHHLECSACGATQDADRLHPLTAQIYTNAVLPVLVDPADPRQMMVDWDAV